MLLVYYCFAIPENKGVSRPWHVFALKRLPVQLDGTGNDVINNPIADERPLTDVEMDRRTVLENLKNDTASVGD